jgi:hypothetical protein
MIDLQPQLTSNTMNDYSIHTTQSSNTLMDKRRHGNLLPLSHDFLAAMTNKPPTTTDTRPSRQIHAITVTEAKLSTEKKRIDLDDFLIWGSFSDNCRKTGICRTDGRAALTSGGDGKGKREKGKDVMLLLQRPWINISCLSGLLLVSCC